MEALRELENDPESVKATKAPMPVKETIKTPEPVEPFQPEVENIPDVEQLIIDEPEPGQKRKTSDSEPPPAKKTRRPKKTIVLSNPPLDADCVKLISERGEMRFLRKRDQLDAPAVSEQLNTESLLGRSISDLRLSAYNERAEGKGFTILFFSFSKLTTYNILDKTKLKIKF